MALIRRGEDPQLESLVELDELTGCSHCGERLDEEIQVWDLFWATLRLHPRCGPDLSVKLWVDALGKMPDRPPKLRTVT